MNAKILVFLPKSILAETRFQSISKYVMDGLAAFKILKGLGEATIKLSRFDSNSDSGRAYKRALEFQNDNFVVLSFGDSVIRSWKSVDDFKKSVDNYSLYELYDSNGYFISDPVVDPIYVPETTLPGTNDSDVIDSVEIVNTPNSFQTIIPFVGLAIAAYFVLNKKKVA